MPLSVPLSLYIHLPWCVQKCPYCDFNSHAVKEGIPETLYVAALLADLKQNRGLVHGRPLVSIFFGGGTPSLFSPQAIEAILDGVQQELSFDPKIEITMEANPGTVDERHFKDFRHIGVNRLSLGVQSFNDRHLKTLGRIHDSQAAFRALEIAREGGFENINIDLMYGLPQQTPAEAWEDLEAGLKLQTTHLSWYQLTIEPNTLFHHTRPPLPTDEAVWEMQQTGLALIQEQGFKQYEVSAYSRPGRSCRHNLNYWEFGDYLGIGAGAHSKITDLETGLVNRHWQVRHPREYLDENRPKTAQRTRIEQKELVFEFMLNALRLNAGVPAVLFEERTGIKLATIEPLLKRARDKKLLTEDQTHLTPTDLGQRFLNDLVALFLT